MTEMPAASALDWVFTVFPAMLRLTCAVACALAALAVRTPPVSTPLLVVVVTLLTGWSLLFAAWMVWRDARGLVMAVDIGLTVGTCLLIRHLVASEVLPGEVSWVAIQASTSVIIAQFVLPMSRSIPAGLLVAAAYGLGAHLAGNDDEAIGHLVTLTVQTGATAALANVARRSSRLADAAFAGYQQAAGAALSARAAREAERQQNRDLHDTVLSTLTVVGLGGVGGQTPLLRKRAASDLRTLAALAGSREPAYVPSPAADPLGGGRVIALDQRLRLLLGRLPELRAHVTLEPCEVPAPVAEAIAHSAAEALSNVLRHAPGATASVRLTRAGQAVSVEVADDGPGFDPETVPRHRYGLRESVHGRMATVGGRAEVESAPGRGTRIRLEWSDVD
ncbi:signal transduction histidine kinase [Plantactinospora soyae]|uniref:histidine kinase n=2 Tax=Plantactinospora soyae TaxID=1544732 RepID=A0A927M4N8_9ACTN|nr:signal transduction histidine kinase [Plantactinospora soyae]